jgi:SAM-dependent methyltransferase
VTRSYQEVNRRPWTHLANRGWPSTRPYGPHHFAHGRELLAPYGWIPWETVTRVLCLGAGGGQQAPLLAALGCRVTAVDLCPEQLERDRAVAEQYGVEIELVEGDMLDLSPLHGCEFDLVYQALSACYVPDVRRIYREVARVLAPGGYYRVEHANPVTMQLPDLDAWDGSAYRLVRPQVPGEPIPWAVPGDGEA